MTIKVDTDIELRQLRSSDAADIFQTIDSQREYLGKWLPFVEFTKELSDTKKFVDSVVQAPQDKLEYIFTIRKQHQFIGLIGFKNTDRVRKKSEIGYWLSETFQKEGIVTKSVRTLCDFAFYELELNKIQIRCAIENKASRNIPERLGFHFDGIEQNGERLTGNMYRDLAVYNLRKNKNLA